jgi:MATE family multidrug resistance protein
MMSQIRVETGAYSNRGEWRALIAIAVPLAASYLAEIAMWFTDIAIVGHLGSLELAAVGLAGDLMAEAFLVVGGVLSVVAVFAANSLGEGDEEAVRRSIHHGLWVATLLSIPLMWLCFSLPDLLALTEQDPRVLEIAGDYVRAAAWGLLPAMYFVILRQYLSVQSSANIVVGITIVAIVLNAGVSYVLVFGKWGLPTLGVMGAGLATAIISWGMFAALVIYIERNRGASDYPLFRGFSKPDLKQWRKIFWLGTPTAGLIFFETGMFAALAIMMGTIGAAELAAGQIVMMFISTTFSVSMAVGEAAGIRVAFHLGAGRPERARSAGIKGVNLGVFFMSAMAMIFLAVPELLSGIFINADDPTSLEVVGIATTLFSIMAIFEIFDGIQAVVSRTLRSMHDAAIPMLLAGVGYWVFGVGGGYFLAFHLGMGVAGLLWGMMLGLGVTALVLSWRYHILSRALIEDEVHDDATQCAVEPA